MYSSFASCEQEMQPSVHQDRCQNCVLTLTGCPGQIVEEPRAGTVCLAFYPQLIWRKQWYSCLRKCTALASSWLLDPELNLHGLVASWIFYSSTGKGFNTFSSAFQHILGDLEMLKTQDFTTMPQWTETRSCHYFQET